KILAFDSDPLAIETARINFAIFSNYDGEKLKKTEFRNIIFKKRDSLKHFFPESPFGILIGNPPWGTDIKPYQKLLQTRFKVLLQSSHQTQYNRPYKIRDQIDIYALFIIQNLKLVQKGGIIALIVPSTILFNPVYAPLRYYLIKNFSILQISYLGEKIFPNVKVPSCILYIRNLSPIKEHLIKISLLNEEYYLNREKLEMFNMDLWSNHHISQKSLLNHPFYNFTIFTRRLNAEILYKIESIEHFVFGDFVNNSRGVELGKNGEVYQCPACKKWNPIPHFKKNPQYPSKFLTKCSHCKKTIEKSQITNYDRIILPLIPNEDKQRKNWAPILIGEDIQPFHLKNRFKILLNYSGIKYKSQEKYNPPKILIRKTGNGIIAALDYKKRYTVQVIYQFSLKYKKIRNSELFYHIKSIEKEKKSIVENEIKKDFKNYQNKGLSQYSLEFLFGIISSTVIEFYYFHSFANPNKKSFPHLIQSNILALPIPKIDFSNRNSISFQLYEKICNNVGKLIKYQEVDSQKIPEKEEIINNINESVAKLFNVSLENLNLEN
ncbi:MAG: Eco57I restriction-modification methylase domain-containing protein, partial [Promethearchaeota archaeon]